MTAIVDQDDLRSWARFVAYDFVDERIDLVISNVLIAALSLGIVGNERFIVPIRLVPIVVPLSLVRDL